MKSGFRRSLGFIAIALIVPSSFGLAANKEADAKSAQATLLDHNQYPCSNCFFGANEYYFCFKADDKILIGRQNIPTMNYQDSGKNYLTKVHKGWMPVEPGATVSLKYDGKYIWIPRAGGKDVRLTQDYSRDIFMDSHECRGAVKK
ncbi:MAG TPA: hypothetical protein VG273_14200 [Bryobacteraceae bacterium]|jgi:hypothetical protein|nr:hypothetical protein [Bryobacteraceae bacterium]